MLDVDAVCLCDRFKSVKQLGWPNIAARFSCIPTNFTVEYKNTIPKTSVRAMFQHCITQRLLSTVCILQLSSSRIPETRLHQDLCFQL